MENNIDDIIKKYKVQSEIKQMIDEGVEIDIHEIIDKYKIDFTNKDTIITEELITELDWEVVLMGLGFIPVIGEAFDVILIMKYLRERRWLEAFIMMIALIPTVGDIIAKPFLIAGKGLKAFSGTGKFTQALKANPQFAGMFKKLEPYLGSPKVMALGKQIAKKDPKLASEIAKGKNFYTKVGKEISDKAMPFHINKFGKQVAGAKKTGVFKRKPKKGLGFASQQHFRSRAISKYVAKHGKLPPNALSTWWNVVYKGRRTRKAAFRKALLASSVFDSLGLPSIEAFQDFIATPEGQEIALNDPHFQAFYNAHTTEEQERIMSQQWAQNSGGQSYDNTAGGDFDLESMLSIPFLKQVAGVVL